MENSKVLALAGGVGGAKLALGLRDILDEESLAIVVNTGDDEEFFGLHVSPDLDTVMYTLGGIANPDTGWGISGETFRSLNRLRQYGADTWFNLGDLDMATHIRRTQLLGQGNTLSEVTNSLCSSLGIAHSIFPMTDDTLRTVVITEISEMSFQEYFVKNRCDPRVISLRFDSPSECSPSPGFVTALNESDLLVFCPSNPFLSVDPILAVPGVRKKIENFRGARVAVSPIVGGEAIKGPAGKILRELGHEVSCVGVAKRYVDLCDVFIIDNVDADLASTIEKLGMRVVVTNTIMNNDQEKRTLAREILSLDY
ncbi:MAG: 2-phospho-L-lactate transferase [Chloroflexota bacterium]|nr:2-phospho-L-lactate transferase [Chloroflexota bacterium]MEC9438857.1 2-phospho-L-lactate transferase [Chloroflexota bacterium]MQF66064.1 2-phospho-L-lactate transferase [SAR202 cluster bacterium AC-647-P02_OGT_505m]PKB60150.1 MAG: 2-phospho-L-lactate transferase [SAR202 cluster bacterium Ae2-Chloro-G1]